MTKRELVALLAATMWAGVTAAEDSEGVSLEEAVTWALDLVDVVEAKVPQP